MSAHQSEKPDPEPDPEPEPRPNPCANGHLGPIEINAGWAQCRACGMGIISG